LTAFFISSLVATGRSVTAHGAGGDGKRRNNVSWSITGREITRPNNVIANPAAKTTAAQTRLRRATLRARTGAVETGVVTAGMS
jgi:hypothetical protein